MVVTDIEREDIPFICKTLGCKPISHIDHLKKDKLGFADLVNYESQSDGGKVLKITGLKAQTDTVSILVRGSNNLVRLTFDPLNYSSNFHRSLMKLNVLFMMHFVLSDALSRTEVSSQEVEPLKSSSLRSWPSMPGPSKELSNAV